MTRTDGGAPDLVFSQDRNSDSDGDGISDADDRCPTEAEDKDGFEDDDGCPDPDNDQDRIPDAADRCPNEPETYNGVQDGDGCPDRRKVLLRKLTLLCELRFEPDHAAVTELAKQCLDLFSTAALERPDELGTVSVVGYADPGERHPAALARTRAQHAYDYLVGRGVSPDRVNLKAESKPLCFARTDVCSELNRRVTVQISN